jgi:spermidine synthase
LALVCSVDSGPLRRQAGIGGGSRLFRRRADFTDWLKGAEINRDRNLRLQYLAGLGLDNNGSFCIYYEMIKRFHYPDDLFVESDDKKTALKKMLGLTTNK